MPYFGERSCLAWLLRARRYLRFDNLHKMLAYLTQKQLVAATKTVVVNVRVAPDVKAAPFCRFRAREE